LHCPRVPRDLNQVIRRIQDRLDGGGLDYTDLFLFNDEFDELNILHRIAEGTLVEKVSTFSNDEQLAVLFNPDAGSR